MAYTEHGAGAMRALLQELYHGDTRLAHRFRYGLLAFDLGTLLFVIATSFRPRGTILESADTLIGLALLVELAARLAASPTPGRDLLHPVTLADAAAIGSFLAPITGEGAGFLRALRTLRLLRAYETLARLREDFPAFCRNEEVFLAATGVSSPNRP
jgi:voltage-gated potassium channel